MTLSPNERQPQTLEQARWQVAYLLSALDAHRALERPHSQHWREKETDYRRRLAQAQVDLDRFA